jgi:lysozyme
MASTMHGIDVSHWQTGLDLADTDAQFVIIKATEGTTYTDPECDAFYQRAKALGLPRGVYHFYRGGGAAEAEFFLRNVDGYIGDALLALDFEDHTSDVAGARAFLQQVYATTGVRPVIYMPASVLAANDWSSVVAGDFGLWLARWASQPGDVSPWTTLALWQHTDAYPTGGMAVDGDFFYGDTKAWAAYAQGDRKEDTVTRTRDEAVTWAKGKVGTTGYGGLCLQFTREAYAIPSKYASAIEAWNKAKHRHSTSSTSGIPVGVPIFLDKSSSEYGHVAVYVGGGRMVTTHASTNKIGEDSVSTWTSDYGYHILGWSEDLNGVLIPDDDGGSSSGGSGGSVKVPDVTVDGVWGSGTTKQRQALLTNAGRYSGPLDGEVSHQNPYWRDRNPGLGSGWDWDEDYKGKGGSKTIKADQTRLSKIKGSDGKPLYRGAIDGLAGEDYFTAVQREQRTTVDGVVSRPSSMVKAMQTDGNAGRLS